MYSPVKSRKSRKKSPTAKKKKNVKRQKKIFTTKNDDNKLDILNKKVNVSKVSNKLKILNDQNSSPSQQLILLGTIHNDNDKTLYNNKNDTIDDTDTLINISTLLEM